MSAMYYINLNAAAVTSGTFTVDYTIQNSWSNGASVNVKITNNGSTINGWSVNWTFPGDQKITNMWGASYSQNGSSVTVTNADYTASIPTNGSQSFGFNISFVGSNVAPSSFTVKTSSPVSPTVTSTITPTINPTVIPTITTTAIPTVVPTGKSSVTTDSHSSTVLNRTMEYNVYLPPSYSSNTSKRYPVMYLLHGMGGSNTDWTSWGMQSIVDKAGGKEMVIIMPNAFNSFYVDGYQSGINYETYMFKELIPYVESKYRIDTSNGKNRAVAGLSMGGFGATYYGFKYPDMFSSSYSMSGALGVTGNLSTVVNKNKYSAYTMECGTEDTLVGQMNVDFHNTLQSLGIPHDYITRSGTHSVDFWKVCLPKAIIFASNHFATN
jgi:S-formylglutathione hydrolase FrmB